VFLPKSCRGASIDFGWKSAMNEVVIALRTQENIDISFTTRKKNNWLLFEYVTSKGILVICYYTSFI